MATRVLVDTTSTQTISGKTLTAPTINSGVLATSTASADPTASLGIATKQYVDVNTPVGSLLLYAGAAAPTGFLLCNGGAVSRTTYASLFAVISTTYGSGDGSTTFNVPDLRGRIPIGVGTGTGGGASGTGLPSGGSGLTNVARGTWKGAETHTLSSSEMPSHTHTVNTKSTTGVFTGPGAAGWDGTTSTNTGSAGGGGAHNNMQPVMGLNFIIKT